MGYTKMRRNCRLSARLSLSFCCSEVVEASLLRVDGGAFSSGPEAMDPRWCFSQGISGIERDAPEADVALVDAVAVECFLSLAISDVKYSFPVLSGSSI